MDDFERMPERMKKEPEKLQEENLRFIRAVIDHNRAAVYDNGFFFVFWGSLVCSGTLASYLFGFLGLTIAIIFIWIAMYVVGIAGILFIRLKKGKTSGGTFADRVHSSLWMGSMISITILGITGFVLKEFDLSVVFSMVAFGIGTACLVSGMISGLTWISALSIGWWAGGVLCMAVPLIWSPAVLGGLTFLFELIPGIFLYRSGRRNGHERKV